MSDIHAEYRAFTARKLSEVADARQTAALQLACGIDLTEALAAGPDLKARLVRRLMRAIERERLRGMRRHWSYDLNRHIALKQALDRLCGRNQKRKAGPRTTNRRRSLRIATK